MRARPRTRHIATVALVALACVGVGTSAPATARPAPVHTIDTSVDLDAPSPWPAPARPSRANGSTLRAAASSSPLSVSRLCVGPTPTPVVDGQPIVVSIDPLSFTVGSLTASAWDHPPSDDAGWQLWFYSMRWAQSVVHRAYRDGQTRSMRAVVDQVLQYYVDHPDDPSVVRPGWDEGASLRRLETLDCLFAATRDARLPAAMATEVTLLSGPRYYGPPTYRVHNHGLMANQRIVVAGQLVGRQDWVDLARRRIAAEAPQAFTPAGTTYEQSTGYHLVNYGMWNDAASVLASLDPADPTPAALSATLRKVQRMSQWFTEPDGDLVQIGDTTRTRGVPGDGVAGLVRDDRAGLLVGRWSWTDPATSYYTLRYGPRRWAHGHDDKGSLTWSTAGTRVLVGPGYTTDSASSRAVPWYRSMAAHNTAEPVRGAFSARGTGVLRSATQTATVATGVVDEYSHGVRHRRAVAVDHARRTATVTDTYPGTLRSRQTWHLDPAWQRVWASPGGTAMRFTHPSGRTLNVTTTGRFSAAQRGSLRPVAGWTYPTRTTRTPAWQLTIRSLTGSVRTAFVVS